ncbi:MAG: response regulator [Myxococcales bacterium]|nr:response regulator [Myxococcales bacterium]
MGRTLSPQTAPARLLVVDDDPVAQALVRAMLAADGYELSFATDGEQALEHLATSAFDVVICDAMMPGIDGFALCQRIKAHPEWRYVPVLLVTALDGDDDMVRGLEAGADEFLTKPIERVRLRARVRVALRIRRQYLALKLSAPDVETLLRRRRQRIIEEAGLTAREREVLELLLLGRSHDEIGVALGISRRTSKFHQSNLLDKLGADSRADLARLFT